MEVNARPIGVFDSGIGGLTVVREIFRLLPGEPVLFFGDTARLPYGPKSTRTVLRFARPNARPPLPLGGRGVVGAGPTRRAALAP